ncbi:PREDICTED: GDSL esterase/lipase 5 isoform X1 [Tarenaya hassleriana]|uniref:GDSL esterase/lipase 5 isoform X1 n=1 Tax=Tarenaya hassleriana TaxID=28532 RepID=UPI00053C9870|nr:PREDICTED: GDSL esterase/lipase 5 isoform X1 [Tarenaya hassleriana]
MAMLRRNLASIFFYFFFLLNILFFVRVSARKSGAKFSRGPNRKRHHGDNVTALFIFGDSFLDAGNNNYINTTTFDQANFRPYGETFFGFPTGRFSDGRLISDFIAEYAKLPLIPPFLKPGISKENVYGVNFASAGAGALVETFKGSVISLKTQLDHYKKVEKMWRRRYGKEEAKKRISRAVHLVSIGSNDYLSPFLTNRLSLIPRSKSRHVGMVMGNLTAFIREIYKIGGRKFGVLNVPDLGCLPVMRVLKPEKDGSCIGEASSLATMHNKALSKLLFQLEEQLKGFKFSSLDMNSSLGLRMRYPSRFGFKEGEGACCGAGEYRGVFSCGGKRLVKEFELCENPNDYVFWDSIHFTEKTYEQIATLFWDGEREANSLAVGPYSIKKLFQIP